MNDIYQDQSTYHGKSADIIGDFWAVGFTEFIGDRAVSSARDGSLARDFVGGSWVRSASTSTTGFGVSGMWATELIHEIGNHTVEVEPVVKTLVSEVDEIVGSDWESLSVELHNEAAHGSVDSSINRHLKSSSL
jgi:hypothetical protein